MDSQNRQQFIIWALNEIFAQNMDSNKSDFDQASTNGSPPSPSAHDFGTAHVDAWAAAEIEASISSESEPRTV